MADVFSRQIGTTTFEAVAGDIAAQDVDALVNAANTSLLGGGGVDGAIHHAAGPLLMQECASLNGCKTGDAKITKGYDLKARHVIHTVGPVYAAQSSVAPYLLASAYRRSLDVAADNQLASVAIPAISTGVFGYPLADAADIAIGTCAAFALSRPTSVSLIRFVLFAADAYQMYIRKLESFRA